MFLLLRFFQLSEIVNSVSPQGQLPLGIALMGRSTAIAQTLVQNGKADVNAYNTDVSILHLLMWNWKKGKLESISLTGMHTAHRRRPTWRWIYRTIFAWSGLWCEFDGSIDRRYRIAHRVHVLGEIIWHRQRHIQGNGFSRQSVAAQTGRSEFTE